MKDEAAGARMRRTPASPLHPSSFRLHPSFQSQHVLHVVEPRGLAVRPERGAAGTTGKGLAAGGFVGQLHALALRGVDDGVVAHDIAAADGVHADLGVGALAHDAMPAVADVCGLFAPFGSKAVDYFVDTMHASPEGHALIAGRIYEALDRLGWLR